MKRTVFVERLGSEPAARPQRGRWPARAATALLVAVLGAALLPTAAPARRVPSDRELERIAAELQAEPRCVAAVVSTVDRRYAAVLSRGLPSCPEVDGHAVLRRRGARWQYLFAWRDAASACRLVAGGYPAAPSPRVALDLGLCRRGGRAVPPRLSAREARDAIASALRRAQRARRVWFDGCDRRSRVRIACRTLFRDRRGCWAGSAVAIGRLRSVSVRMRTARACGRR